MKNTLRASHMCNNNSWKILLNYTPYVWGMWYEVLIVHKIRQHFIYSNHGSTQCTNVIINIGILLIALILCLLLTTNAYNIKFKSG